MVKWRFFFDRESNSLPIKSAEKWGVFGGEIAKGSRNDEKVKNGCYNRSRINLLTSMKEKKIRDKFEQFKQGKSIDLFNKAKIDAFCDFRQEKGLSVDNILVCPIILRATKDEERSQLRKRIQYLDSYYEIKNWLHKGNFLGRNRRYDFLDKEIRREIEENEHK